MHELLYNLRVNPAHKVHALYSGGDKEAPVCGLTQVKIIHFKSRCL